MKIPRTPGKTLPSDCQYQLFPESPLSSYHHIPAHASGGSSSITRGHEGSRTPAMIPYPALTGGCRWPPGPQATHITIVILNF